MAKFHFVEDYERHVAGLIEKFPIDEAMAMAVGGAGTFDTVGTIEMNVMTYAGLANGKSLIDLGCGSGRLAGALGRALKIEYLGLDIVQSLLDYAKTITPKNYRFELSRALTLPAPDASADFVSAFSVFTHLLHSETYLYLDDAMRALRPGGKVVFSFLEFANPAHWAAFEGEVNTRRTQDGQPLNMMIERNVIECWAAKLGYRNVEIIGGDQAPWNGPPMWQAVAILQKP